MQIASDANDMSECTRHRFAETMSFVADRVLYATLECLGSDICSLSLVRSFDKNMEGSTQDQTLANLEVFFERED